MGITSPRLGVLSLASLQTQPRRAPGSPWAGQRCPSPRHTPGQPERHFLCQKYLEESKRSGVEGSCKAEEALRRSKPRYGDSQGLERDKSLSGLCSLPELHFWQR